LEKIIYKQEVRDFLTELIFNLFEKEYFGFKESAEEYTMQLIDFIEITIDKGIEKKTPIELTCYGEFYLCYNASKRTTWYIFFNKSEENILVNYISNNHLSDSGFLNILS
jgi:hypothetical protein